MPGAWELPVAARRLLATERYDALVAVGAVIRGDTPHFDSSPAKRRADWRARASSSTCRSGSALLTCDNDEQAEARAGGAHGNKGWDAALAALEMADLFDRLDAANEG